MRFLRQSMIGVFLAAVTLGLLAYAGQLIGGAVQDRMANDTKAPPARERVFTVNVIVAEAGTQTPVLQKPSNTRIARGGCWPCDRAR
jgi:membrane fusion protein (multidrug efflux system)